MVQERTDTSEDMQVDQGDEFIAPEHDEVINLEVSDPAPVNHNPPPLEPAVEQERNKELHLWATKVCQ